MSFIKILPYTAFTLMFSCSFANYKNDTGDSIALDLEEGLVIHLPFDEDASDKGKRNLHADLKNGAHICEDAAVGKGAVCLDGVDDFIELPSNEIYFSGDYTISLWCKWEALGEWTRILDFNSPKPGNGNGVTWLLGRKDTPDMSMMWFDQWVKHNSFYVESIVDFNNKPAEPEMGYNIKKGEWEHYVLVFDSKASNPVGTKLNTKGEEVPFSGKVTLYVNGKKTSENYYAVAPQNVPTIKNHLGKSLFPSDPVFKGVMDDFRIYKKKVDADLISALFNVGKNI